MLSIVKIGPARGRGSKAGYASYLGAGSRRGEFDDYARGSSMGPAPFWACRGAALLGLDGVAEAEQVERLAKGMHPLTGEPLVRGAGEGHVAGLDMTFSAPKDVSAVFAGADPATRAALIEAVQGSARAALDFAERADVARLGHGGRTRQLADAGVAACYTHLASRGGELGPDPQLHVHALKLNVGKRAGSEEWSALEQRPQFERKMATGILFRAELAARVKALGFEVQAAGPYFQIVGVTDEQRAALSGRSAEIAKLLRETGRESAGPAERDRAALATRSAKAEPPLPELLAGFSERARELGLTPASVAAMRAPKPALDEPFAIDHDELLERLLASRSCATGHEAVAAICELAMGRWGAAECLSEAERFMESEHVVRLGRTELLAEVFTSKATLAMESEISARVEAGKADRSHSVPRALVDEEFDRLEGELKARLGIKVSLAQQREAAVHVACETGLTALLVGWAGTGKSTLMNAAGAAFRAAGLEVRGCCQSASAARSLEREAGIPSRTIASLMLALREGRTSLGPSTVLVLDEAGMVGSREFHALQEAAVQAGAKLVCVGDPKQLQPIEAGGVFASLIRIHGAAEISAIQRQRTDFEPLLRWVESRPEGFGGVSKDKAAALRSMPEEARVQAFEALGELDPKLARAFARWRARFDFEWMREAVELFAKGEALPALRLLDERGRLRMEPTREAAMSALIDAWAADKTPLDRKTMIAGTRAEVLELNARARELLVERGAVDDALGVEVESLHRDGSSHRLRLAPGDRVVFMKNDRSIGVVNGASGWVRAVAPGAGAAGGPAVDAILSIELDEANDRGERTVRAPASFGWINLASCLTNQKSQGRTFDSVHALANPAMADREWTYVAASRSRFATTLYVDESALGLVDPESHAAAREPVTRSRSIEALAARMRRSRAKGTSLDYEVEPKQDVAASPNPIQRARELTREMAAAFVRRLRGLAPEPELAR